MLRYFHAKTKLIEQKYTIYVAKEKETAGKEHNTKT